MKHHGPYTAALGKSTMKVAKGNESLGPGWLIDAPWTRMKWVDNKIGFIKNSQLGRTGL